MPAVVRAGEALAPGAGACSPPLLLAGATLEPVRAMSARGCGSRNAKDARTEQTTVPGEKRRAGPVVERQPRKRFPATRLHRFPQARRIALRPRSARQF